MFEEFPKIARLSRGIVVTEKIDGTNAQVHIVPAVDVVMSGLNAEQIIAHNDVGDLMLAGSRNRYITPQADNFGFAAWVQRNADALWALGPGRHFGEWWGSGVQRGYGLQNGEKRWSLFNTARWSDDATRPACCGVVPILYAGPFCETEIHATLASLREHGSRVAPGFMQPEGVVIYHVASRTLFKKTLEKDDEPKGKTAA